MATIRPNRMSIKMTDILIIPFRFRLLRPACSNRSRLTALAVGCKIRPGARYAPLFPHRRLGRAAGKSSRRGLLEMRISRGTAAESAPNVPFGTSGSDGTNAPPCELLHEPDFRVGDDLFEDLRQALLVLGRVAAAAGTAAVVTDESAATCN